MITPKNSNAKKTSGNAFPPLGNAEPQLGFKSEGEDAKDKTAKLGLGDPRFRAIRELAESLQLLNRQAVKEYTPLVEDIIHTRSRDVRHIEHTLDGLLDFCGYDPSLQLYRQLCRHYYDIDPVATVSYVNAYREMWDSEPENTSVVMKSRNTDQSDSKKTRRKRRTTVRETNKGEI
jgi:hypothetical protein